jgi:hypothetical protein
LAWALGELNGFYLAFAVFAVEFVAAFVWPIIRGRNQQRGSA